MGYASFENSTMTHVPGFLKELPMGQNPDQAACRPMIFPIC
jgi:hypothetical protein